MKHWFLTAVRGEQEDGVQYTVCTQKFFIDEDRILIDLAGLFQNTGVGLDSWPLRVYIAKNSVGMVDDKGVRRPMAPLSQAQQILMGALAAGYVNKPDIQDAMAYLTHLQNVLAKNAMGAYVAEVAKAHIISPSEGDDGA